MSDILHQLADMARARTEREKREMGSDRVRSAALSMPRGDMPFEAALSRPGVSFICEVKRASPSKGIIAEHFPYLDIAREYDEAGADAISVLTEPEKFLGRDEYLAEIASSVGAPCLRKDFVVDDFMIYRAKILGAAAVLLICAITPRELLADWLALCGELGLSALVEAHDEAEIDTALSCGARIIGVNNRDLRDFSVDTGNSARLRASVPEGTLFVAESGIKSASDVDGLRRAGVDAVLIGETLMRAADKRAKLAELRGA